MEFYGPGTPNNQFKLDVWMMFGEKNISYVKVLKSSNWNNHL